MTLLQSIYLPLFIRNIRKTFVNKSCLFCLIHSNLCLLLLLYFCHCNYSILKVVIAFVFTFFKSLYLNCLKSSVLLVQGNVLLFFRCLKKTSALEAKVRFFICIANKYFSCYCHLIYSQFLFRCLDNIIA